MNIKTFANLDKEKQREICCYYFKKKEKLKKNIYFLEYQILFDPFIQNDISKKIRLDNDIDKLRNQINELNIKINIISKVMNNYIIWEV